MSVLCCNTNLHFFSCFTLSPLINGTHINVKKQFAKTYLLVKEKYKIDLPESKKISEDKIEVILITSEFSSIDMEVLDSHIKDEITLITYAWFEEDILLINYLNNAPSFEKIEKEKIKREKLEQKRLEKEKLEQKRLEKERLEEEKLEQERLRQEVRSRRLRILEEMGIEQLENEKRLEREKKEKKEKLGILLLILVEKMRAEKLNEEWLEREKKEKLEKLNQLRLKINLSRYSLSPPDKKRKK